MRSSPAGRFGGTASLQDPFFRASYGGFAAVAGTKRRDFEGGKPPPNPHRVSRVDETSIAHQASSITQSSIYDLQSEQAMRLGVVDMLPKDFRTCTPAHLSAITALGFTGFGCHLDGALAF